MPWPSSHHHGAAKPANRECLLEVVAIAKPGLAGQGLGQLIADRNASGVSVVHIISSPASNKASYDSGGVSSNAHP